MCGAVLLAGASPLLAAYLKSSCARCEQEPFEQLKSVLTKQRLAQLFPLATL